MTELSKPKKYQISDEELNTLIQRYTRDITEQARQGKFDPITGRDKELDRITLILLQRLRKNVLLLGPAGTGKTALFIGFAQMLVENKVPDLLKGSRLIELEMSMLGAGSQSRADLEGRLIPIIKGVAERNAAKLGPPIIFCIDEIHQLMIGFKSSSYSGIADLLKPYLTVGDLFVIGATTREEYEDYMRTEPAIDRRFQKLFLEVPDVDSTIEILKNLRPRFEEHSHLKISDRAIERIVKLAERFLRNRNNPDKSIITLDQACAYAIKRGITGELDDESISVAIAEEAGVNPKAVG